MRKRSLIHGAVVVTLVVGVSSPMLGNDLEDGSANVAVQWNDAAVTAIKNTSTPPTVASRALFIVHSAMYDAWAAYDAKAAGSVPGAPPRQPQNANTALLNKAAAVSYAAYRTLIDLFPTQVAAFRLLMINNGYDPAITTTTPSTPPGVGNAAAANQLAFRHSDGSNQLGDLGGAPYSDYTGYEPVNFPDNLTDPNRWQPVRAADATVQKFLSPHWGKVKPFSLRSADQFRPGPPAQAGTWLYEQRMRDAIRLQAEMDDRGKMCAEYWDDGANSETPPGHWNRIAEEISKRNLNDLDTDVKMYFVLNAGLFDVSVAVWDAKRTYDAIRPQSAIRFFYQGKQITGFSAGAKGMASIDGSEWRSWITTAPHPEFPSGHSAFSSSSAEILRRITGSDSFAWKLTFAAGSSKVQPGTAPAKETTMEYLTFSEIADDAGYSRRVGGIHNEEADFRSRTIGRQVAGVGWEKFLQLTSGVQ
jgi:hypothetical protein